MPRSTVLRSLWYKRGPGGKQDGVRTIVRGHFTSARRRALLCALALLSVATLAASGCRGGPPADVARGARTSHPTLPLSMVLPDGWQISSPREGFSLIRSMPYGGGYPTFNVRVVSPEDLPSLRFDGKTAEVGPGRAEYRYERWSNARGRGYRLEALIDAGGTWVFADGSVWDAAGRMDQQFFDEVFWPLINSVAVGAP